MNGLRMLAMTAVGAVVILSGCDATDPITLVPPSIDLARVPDAEPRVYSPALDQMRQRLLAAGVTHVELASAELRLSRDGIDEQGKTTLIANDRTHTLGSLFVENDPRRGSGSAITYLVDQSDGTALSVVPGGQVVVLTNAETEPAIDAAMNRWRVQTRCPGPPILKIADPGADPDLADFFITGDASLLGTPFADITHAGWLPGAFFDLLLPGGSSVILGVTLTFEFIDGAGNPTDIDRNGLSDAAFREIYYNRAFPWTTSASNPFSVDIESVVTHEAGHAFGVGHFGKVFIDNKGVVKFAPLAIMNSVYVFAFREIVGTDRASFCSIWANSW